MYCFRLWKFMFNGQCFLYLSPPSNPSIHPLSLWMDALCANKHQEEKEEKIQNTPAQTIIRLFAVLI